MNSIQPRTRCFTGYQSKVLYAVIFICICIFVIFAFYIKATMNEQSSVFIVPIPLLYNQPTPKEIGTRDIPHPNHEQFNSESQNVMNEERRRRRMAEFEHQEQDPMQIYEANETELYAMAEPLVIKNIDWMAADQSQSEFLWAEEKKKLIDEWINSNFNNEGETPTGRMCKGELTTEEIDSILTGIFSTNKYQIFKGNNVLVLIGVLQQWEVFQVGGGKFKLTEVSDDLAPDIKMTITQWQAHSTTSTLHKETWRYILHNRPLMDYNEVYRFVTNVLGSWDRDYELVEGTQPSTFRMGRRLRKGETNYEAQNMDMWEKVLKNWTILHADGRTLSEADGAAVKMGFSRHDPTFDAKIRTKTYKLKQIMAKDMAEKYFGEEVGVWKQIEWDGKQYKTTRQG